MNKNLNQWGAYSYDEGADVARVKAGVSSGDSLEAFSIGGYDGGVLKALAEYSLTNTSPMLEPVPAKEFHKITVKDTQLIHDLVSLMAAKKYFDDDSFAKFILRPETDESKTR